jgi:hypothetical protein
VITPTQLAASGSEHGHQAALFCFAQQSGIEELKWLFAVPNGFYATPKAKATMKAEGLKSGVPDIWLPVPMDGCYGLVIELKVGKNKPTKEQQEWIDYLNNAGYYARVCYGWEHARDRILMYLGRM